MTTIILTTVIQAPIEKCFDLSLSVDVHIASTSKTKEFVYEGRKKGIMEKDEIITWRAKHFGVWQNLTVKITEVSRPDYFVDEMVKGAFKSMKHKHLFKEEAEGTIMTDIFEYETPFRIFGKLFDMLLLKSYMTEFLKERNSVLKRFAESV